MASNPSGQLAVGLSGAGLAGKRHARAWRAVTDLGRLVAVADPDPDAGRRVAEEIGARWYEDQAAMLAAERLDAVDICVPPSLHVGLVRAAAAADLHILCEKPIAPTLEEAHQIADVVRSAGITYMAAHNTLFLPTVARAATLISRGDLGPVHMIRSLDCFDGPWTAPERLALEEAPLPEFFAPGAWRTRNDELHGGILVDAGAHPIYRLLHLAGAEPVSVLALTRNFNARLAWQAEDTAILLIEFANDVIGEVIVSHAFGPPLTGGETLFGAIGKEGYLGGSDTTLYLRPSGWSEPAAHELWPLRGREVVWIATLELELRHFLECVRTGTAPISGVAEATVMLEVIRAAYRSAQEGRRVALA